MTRGLSTEVKPHPCKAGVKYRTPGKVGVKYSTPVRQVNKVTADSVREMAGFCSIMSSFSFIPPTFPPSSSPSSPSSPSLPFSSRASPVVAVCEEFL